MEINKGQTRGRSLRALLVGSSTDDRTSVAEALAQNRIWDVELRHCGTVSEIDGRVSAGRVDVVIANLAFDTPGDEQALHRLAALFNCPVVVLLERHPSTHLSALAGALGIKIHVWKNWPLSADQLESLVAYALTHHNRSPEVLHASNHHLAEALHSRERALELLSTYVRTLSHDIRGPLCTLEGLLLFPHRELGPDEVERLRSYQLETVLQLKSAIDYFTEVLGRHQAQMQKIGTLQPKGAVATT